MSNAVFLALDTETGGLKPATKHPLLSAALVAADAQANEIDSLYVKFHPPAGTVLEVPILSHQNPIIKAKQIDYFVDVFTGAKLTRDETYDRPVITAYAAEVNGYMTVTPAGWDLKIPPEWHRGAVNYEQGTATIFEFLLKHFTTPPLTIAHNVPFDHEYVATHLPKVHAVLGQWVCTCDGVRNYYKKTGQKGKATLDALCKLASYDQLEIDRVEIHSALPDARGALAGFRWLRTQG